MRKSALAVLLLAGLVAAKWTADEVIAICTPNGFAPSPALSRLDTSAGYRLSHAIQDAATDEDFVLLLLSGGGARATSFGYGVLETLRETPFGKSHLLDAIDVVYGVSGGAVLAAYFALHGEETLPSFEKRFLNQDFEEGILKSWLRHLPFCGAPEFGRGDLLQAQLNEQLFNHATFSDLHQHRRGPFAVISATDMSAGRKVSFHQEFFDVLCVDLLPIEVARAVAASASVPLLFEPLTFNNHGGRCAIADPVVTALPVDEASVPEGLKGNNVTDMRQQMKDYQNTTERPFLHLLDGGLTDNLGLSNLLDIQDVIELEEIYQKFQKLGFKRVVIINVNAQNEIQSDIDQSPAVPKTNEMINAVINIPIDKNSELALRRFREFVDGWHQHMNEQPKDQQIPLYFISLRLVDLPENQSALREKVLNIGTSFALPKEQVEQLRRAGKILLEQNETFQKLTR